MARDFCEGTGSGALSLSNIHFDFSWYGNRGNLHAYAFCKQPRDFLWWKAACERDQQSLSNFPESLTIYALGAYDAAKMLGGLSADSREQFLLQMASIPRTERSDDVEERSADGHTFFAVRDTNLVARCQKALDAKLGTDLYCQTGYPLTAGIGLVYDFRARSASLAHDIRRADDGAQAIFASLGTIDTPR